MRFRYIVLALAALVTLTSCADASTTPATIDSDSLINKSSPGHGLTSYNLTEIAADALAEFSSAPRLGNIQLDENGMLVCEYSDGTGENPMLRCITVDLSNGMVTAVEDVSTDGSSAISKCTNGRYTAFNDYESGSEFYGNLYVIDNLTGEQRLVDEANIRYDSEGIVLVQGYSVPSAWRFDGDILYYMMGYYEGFGSLGIYDCATGEKHYFSGAHPPVSICGDLIYTGDIYYAGWDYAIFTYDGDSFTETVFADPDGLNIYDGYIIDDMIDAETERLYILKSEQKYVYTFLQIDLSDGVMKLLHTFEFCDKNLTPSKILIADDCVLIYSYKIAGGEDHISIAALKS